MAEHVGPNTRELLEFGGRSVALAVALGFVLSVGYDYGYLMILGLNFQDIPSTISDHIRTALIWLPVAMMVAIGNIGLIWRFGGNNHGEVKKKPKSRQAARVLVALVLVFVNILVAWLADKAILLIAIILSLGVLTAIIAFKPLYAASHLRSTVRLLALLACSFLVLMAFGMYAASYGTAKAEPVRILLKDAPDAITARTVRYFERGALLANWPAPQVLFVPWDQVKEIRSTSSHRLDERGFCLRFGWGCPATHSGQLKNP